MAMQAQDKQDMESAKALLSAAVSLETGLYARRAAEHYLNLLKSQSDGPGLLAFVKSEGAKNLTPWTRALTEAEALSMAGRHSQALNSWTKLLTAYPEEAKDNEIIISAGMLLAALELGTPRGSEVVAEEFRFLMELAGGSTWYKTMANVIKSIQAKPTAVNILSQQELLLAQARVLSGTRDYGAAVLAFRRYHASTTGTMPPLDAQEGALLASSLNRPALSDMARAFLFGSKAEGEAIFSLLADQARDNGMDSQVAYLRLFWAGRFARASERWRDAAGLFAAATELATVSADLDAADSDAALWYEIEARSKYSASEAVAALARAYSVTGNPSYYSDLLEPLSRKALAERSGTVLAAIISAAAPVAEKAPGATARDRARLDYLGARAVATGLIGADQLTILVPEGGEASGEAYISLALNRAYAQEADPWYRLLAAYRLGLPLVEPADGPGSPAPPPGPANDATNPTAPVSDILDQDLADQADVAQDSAGIKAPVVEVPVTIERDTDTPREADDFARGMIRFGLARKVRTELGAWYRSLQPTTIRFVALALTLAGDHGEAIRAIAPLFSRAGYIPTRQDRELYWPKAFPEETSTAAQRFELPEALLSGLVRSESLFQPEVVSSAGAVGLAQLMPATAEETARRLRLTEYDVRNPSDNLTLGAAYFRRILDNQSGRFMPAIFSYNAGPTRFRRWETQYGPLPQDILLEVLDYAETRQYGRNVVAAAMAYATLYYEQDLHGFLAQLLGE